MLINNEKQKGLYAHSSGSSPRRPLTARPLDLLYFLFFAIHLPASLIIDLQYIYPPHLVPALMRSALESYVAMSRDPLIGGIFGFYGEAHSAGLVWFKTFLVLEAVFQVPVFVLGLRALYKGSRSIYPLLTLYAASSATTTLACLVLVLAAPALTPATIAQNPHAPGVTHEQRLLLLSSYIPFFVIALVMAVDMACRVGRLMEKGVRAEEEREKEVKWE